MSGKSWGKKKVKQPIIWNGASNLEEKKIYLIEQVHFLNGSVSFLYSLDQDPDARNSSFSDCICRKSCIFNFRF